MELQIHASAGKLEVGDAVFGAEFNETLVHQLVTAYLAGGRAGTKGTKNRSDVRGGGRKPWRQKGTGRARAGTIRSPIWRGGGHTFAFTNRDFGQKLNKKMYRAALRSILSELARQDRLRIVEAVALADHKTKTCAAWLKELGAEGRVLVVAPELDVNLVRGSQNLAHVELCESAALNPVALVGADVVIISSAAAQQISERLA